MTLMTTPGKSSPFSDLPVEIYENIVRHIESASSLANLSKTCQRLASFADIAGWRKFSHSRFPSLASTPLSLARFHEPGYWRNVAQLLTSQSRSWDRRALLATAVDPYSDYNARLQKCLDDDHALADSMASLTIKSRTPNAQSAGFHPVLDCDLELGNDISSKREVLAIGAGADLFIRVRSSGHFVRSSDWLAAMDQHGQQTTWYTAGAAAGCFQQGRDDITSVNIIDSHTLNAEAAYVDVITGRANGTLQRLSISRIKPQVLCVANFVKDMSTDNASESFGEPIVSADLNKFNHPHLAVTSKKTLCLYDTSTDSQLVLPVSKIQTDLEDPSCQNYSTKFLSGKRLAVTGRSSRRAIQVFEMSESRLEATPIHTFNSFPDDHVSGNQAESVFALEPVSPSLNAGGSRQGDMFISGWFDGICRLYDLRTPGVVSTYRDPLDHDSAIYSLATFGQERFVVGGARHSLLKIFDFRMPGSKCYSYTNASQSSPGGSTSNKLSASRHQNLPNWGVYLGPWKKDTRQILHMDSPVFSLKAVSPYSPVLYAGTSNHIFEINAIAASDTHFEPYYGDYIGSIYPPAQRVNHMLTQNVAPHQRTTVGYQEKIRSVQKWDPLGDCLNLKMVETDDGTSVPGPGTSMLPKLRAQGNIGGDHLKSKSSYDRVEERLDERWLVD